MNSSTSYSFHPIIDQPTRIYITPTSSTLIDNILTNNDSITSAGILNADISDHLPLFQVTPSVFQVSKGHSETYMTRAINSETIRSFVKDLELMNWSEVFDCQDANSTYNTFLSLLTSSYNLHFPFTLKKKWKDLYQTLLDYARYCHFLPA